MFLEEQKDGQITLEVTLISYFPIDYNNAENVEGSRRILGRGRHSETDKMRNVGKGEHEVGKRDKEKNRRYQRNCWIENALRLSKEKVKRRIPLLK